MAFDNLVWKEGTDPGTNKMEANFNWLGEGCLKTLGTPLLLGRDFSERDRLSSPRVAIVNQSFARRLGLPANPVGAK